MRHELEAWLLRGEELPEGYDLPTALEANVDLADLAHDFETIDAAARLLPSIPAPPELNGVLDAIDAMPQDAPMPSLDVTAPPAQYPVANRRTWLAAVAVLAAALLVWIAIPPTATEPLGNPSEWTERGGENGFGPDVFMNIAVQRSNGEATRFVRGTQYAARRHARLSGIDRYRRARSSTPRGQ